MSALILDDVCVSYGRVHAICHLTGQFEAGSLTAIAGANGAGKSTLVKAIMGELPLTNGNINRGELTPQEIAYLPQTAEIDRHFPLNLEDLVSLGTWRKNGAFRGLSNDCLEEAKGALRQVGLAGMEKRQIASLSSGQFQRALFARLILQDARVVILDEPFNAVDEQTTNDLLTLILQWNNEGRTVLAILHDLEQIERHFPNTLLLAREAVYWGNTQQALSAQNKQRAKSLIHYWDNPQRQIPPLFKESA
jgi:zinc/manganese transport system ATP-binding protein